MFLCVEFIAITKQNAALVLNQAQLPKTSRRYIFSVRLGTDTWAQHTLFQKTANIGLPHFGFTKSAMH
jgi:hypothetical protein